MNRREFFKTSGIITAGVIIAPNIVLSEATKYPQYIYKTDYPIFFCFYIPKGTNELQQRALATKTIRCYSLEEFTNRHKDKVIFIYEYNPVKGYVRAVVPDIPPKEILKGNMKPYYEN